VSDSYRDPYGSARRTPPDEPHVEQYGEPSGDPFGHSPDDAPSSAPPYRPPVPDGKEYGQAGEPGRAPAGPPPYAPPYSRSAAAPATPAASVPVSPAGKAATRAARRPRATRSRFWLGFVLAFSLLSLATCGGMAVALGLDELRISDFAGNGTAWTPPTLMPTPEAPAEASASATGDATGAPVASGRFALGQTVRNITNSRVNVRRTPGHLGKGGDDVIIQVQAGDPVVIQGESAGADNLTWWLVSYQGVEGWMAESTASGVQILGE
jgi:hypothetical protein